MEQLSELGKVAGVAGVALGIFVLIARNLIESKLANRVSPREARRFLTTILVATSIVALVGIGSWVFVALTPFQSVEIVGDDNTTIQKRYGSQDNSKSAQDASIHGDGNLTEQNAGK
ncbi:MAG TPA: hypothetical protein VGO04_24060 [Ensifer sp.]|jgi:hypothetical protein|uniref:hypothetical protein n=1 Tax=Ensifer sp. TaxID=1872086 RepID=UPI002E144774|nr:hypothetical protein [Ensifer sp.]